MTDRKKPRELMLTANSNYWTNANAKGRVSCILQCDRHSKEGRAMRCSFFCLIISICMNTGTHTHVLTSGDTLTVLFWCKPQCVFVSFLKSN